MKSKRPFPPEELGEIVQQAQHGNKEAMEMLIASSERTVYFHCLRFLRNQEDVVDAVQDIFLSAIENLKTLRQPEAFYQWIRSITVNYCKSKLIKNNQSSNLIDLSSLDNAFPLPPTSLTQQKHLPYATLETQETQKQLLRLIDRLPDGQRICVTLYYYDELSQREIADLLDIPLGTVKSRLSKARFSLKRWLQQLGYM